MLIVTFSGFFAIQPPCAAQQSPPNLTITPISTELALFDVVITSSTPVLDAVATIRALPDTKTATPAKALSISFPFLPATHDDSISSSRCRIMLPPGWSGQTVQVSVACTVGTGQVQIPPEVLDLRVPDAERVPAWALGATWYQIFPERFRDGDPSNNPAGPLVTTVPWNSDFSSVTPEEIERAWSRQRSGDPRSRSNWSVRGGARRATIYSRRYGGDLIGLVQSLPHIESLGVTALYLCPVFESSSLHKYDAADFLHIDPTFGPAPAASRFDGPSPEWTPADRYLLDTVLPSVRARSMRLVLDGVWNHTGTDHWAFRDLISRGRDSPYAAWYLARFDDAGSLIGWQAWDSTNGNLPEFRQTDAGDLDPSVSSHIFEVTRRWMDPDDDGDPSDGIDGWRLDVAPEIGMPFWERWRRHVRTINPDAALYGEIWFDAGPWFGGKAFDAQMNYPFAIAVVEWCAGAPRTTSARLNERLARVFSHAPQNDLAQMNLFGSHDTPRLLSMLSRPNAAYDDGETAAALGRESLTAPPSREILARAEIAVAIQALWLGSPMIYAGDELGMVGPDDPDNRAPLPWPDTAGPTSSLAAANASTLNFYRRWFTLRSDPDLKDTIRYGTVRSIETGDPDAFAFQRALNAQRILLIANRGDKPVDAAPWLPISMRDSMDTRVPALSARVFHWQMVANKGE